VSEGAGLLLLLVGLGGLGATGALAACCLRLRSPIEYLLASYLLNARLSLAIRGDDWIHPFFGPTLSRHVELVSPRRGTPSRGVQWLVLGPNAAVVRCGGSWQAVFENEAGWRVERRVAPDRCPSPSD
jgi:hypothetical protein